MIIWVGALRGDWGWSDGYLVLKRDGGKRGGDG